MNNNPSYVAEVLKVPENLIRAVFSGEATTESIWIKVSVKPVEIQGKLMWRFSYFERKKDITKNYDRETYLQKISELVEMGFKNISVETKTEIIQVNKVKDGRLVFSKKVKAEIEDEINLSHDHQKDFVISAADNADFLNSINITDLQGNIKNSKKFHQINEFLKLVSETITTEFLDKNETINIVDCGCGNAYLTFSLYYYFSKILSKKVKIVGVDTNQELMERHEKGANELGWDISFVNEKIIDFAPDFETHIVVALHACDTATDEAISKAILWNSQYIFSVPCCHHNVQVQLDKNKDVPKVLNPILDQGILKERLGDILTDSFRVMLLKLKGYKTEIVQFVDIEHTAKNLMIRSIYVGKLTNYDQIKSEYEALKQFTTVEPYLEGLI
ncbi:MAG: SAM-dependent methyltransferase [Candidatus Shapirobacteria bacterium]